jgi:hypothetical protein
MTKDEQRIAKLVQQLNLETHRRKLAEQQVRALRITVTRLMRRLSPEPKQVQETQSPTSDHR